MSGLNRRRLKEELLDLCSLDSDQKSAISEEQRLSRKSMGRLLVEKKLLTEEKLLAAMEEHLGIPQVNLYSFRIGPEAAGCIGLETARRHQVIPLRITGKKLYLGMSDPLNLEAIDDVGKLTGFEIHPVLAGQGAVAHAINRQYCIQEPLTTAASAAQKKDAGIAEAEKSETVADETPVIKVVNSLIKRAMDEKASDIHLEPSAEGLRVRMRLDGVLHDLAALPHSKQVQIISRVKVMADLDIAEKRLPQDGNIQLHNSGEEINLRVSTMPTVDGEKAVIRILEKERIVLPLEKLGFSSASYRVFQRLLLNQSGMVLVTGPTGCGKTTTLYSALSYLNRPEDNIITVEDPVECRLKGINQVQVSRRIDRTFANALRFILRQDPNIIMVGEIRDLETAKIAVQAALTGHLVLSTLHTNNAAGAMTRLIDMGMEPYMVTASIVGVIAQRLIRMICEKCRENYYLSDEEKTFFRQYFGSAPPETLTRGSGCRNCNNTGYRGRSSIQELLLLNHDIQELVLGGATAIELQNKAVEQGMVPLIKDGLRSIEAGQTTVSEIVRATFSSVFDTESSDYAGSSAFIAHLQKNSR